MIIRGLSLLCLSVPIASVVTFDSYPPDSCEVTLVIIHGHSLRTPMAIDPLAIRGLISASIGDLSLITYIGVSKLTNLLRNRPSAHRAGCLQRIYWELPHSARDVGC